jgi:hypothetical protein
MGGGCLGQEQRTRNTMVLLPHYRDRAICSRDRNLASCHSQPNIICQTQILEAPSVSLALGVQSLLTASLVSISLSCQGKPLLASRMSINTVGENGTCPMPSLASALRQGHKGVKSIAMVCIAALPVLQIELSYRAFFFFVCVCLCFFL